MTAAAHDERRAPDQSRRKGDLELQTEGVIVRIMLTTDSATDLFLGDLTRRGYSQRTVDTYRRILNKLCDRLPDDYDVARITTDDCRRFLDQFNTKAPGTRAHVYAVLSSFFGWMIVNEKTKRSPLATLTRPKRTRPDDLEVTSLSSEDVRLLLDAGVTWTEKLAIAIPAYLGPRRHAVAVLKRSDYNRETGHLRFCEKGGKVIWKPVPADLRDLLDAAITAGAIREADDYLVPPEGHLQRKGLRDDRIIWRVVKRVADRAGVDAHVHALRAAFACFYLESNPGDTYGLKELLGHRSFETTQVYLRKLDKGAAMERVRELSWVTVLPADLSVVGFAQVYFIAAGDIAIDGTPVKIGYSVDPADRISDLQPAHHTELVLAAAVPGGPTLEAQVHRALEADRIRGEWFLASDRMRSLIDSLVGVDSNKSQFASSYMGAGGFEPPFTEPEATAPLTRLIGDHHLDSDLLDEARSVPDAALEDA